MATVSPLFRSAVTQLEAIARIDDVKARFQQLPENNRYTTQTVLDKSHALGTVVLGLLAGYAYKQAQKHVAIVLGVVAVAHLFAARISTKVPTDACREQMSAIKDLFYGLQGQMEAMHGKVSAAIVTVIEKEQINEVAVAEARDQELVTAYLEQNRPFNNLEIEDQAWATLFKDSSPAARYIATWKAEAINQDADLHPVLKAEITKLIPLAQRLVFGKESTRNEGNEYVNANSYVQLVKGEGQQYVAASIWPVAQRA